MAGFEGKTRKSDLIVGGRWGRLLAVETGIAEHDLDEWQSLREEFMLMRCDCGKEFKIWSSEWKGKRKMKDCGCGLSALDGLTVIKCISMPAGIWAKIKTCADQKGLTVSKAIVDLIIRME